jgi:hypothetical protein
MLEDFPKLKADAFKLAASQIPFKKFQTFENDSQLDEFLRTEYPFVKVHKSQMQGCSECSQRKSGHQMRMKRVVCECNINNCNLEFKIHKCDIRKKIVVYIKGFDIHSHKDMLKGDVADGASKKAQVRSNGIHIAYKKALLKLLDDDPELTAKRALIKITKNNKKSSSPLPGHLLPQLEKVNIIFFKYIY